MKNTSKNSTSNPAKTELSPKISTKVKKSQNNKLNGIADIPRYFYKNEIPIYFISATNFNLLGTDEWIKRFKFISYIECFNGLHPNVFSPKEEVPQDDFTSIEDINNYLLMHPEVQDCIKTRANGKKAKKAMFLMFDEKTEKLAKNKG